MPATSCRPLPSDVRRKEVIAFPVAALVVGLRTGHGREGDAGVSHVFAVPFQHDLPSSPLVNQGV